MAGAPRPKRPLPPLADPGRRLRVATTLVLALFVVIGLRLVAIQLTDAKAYAAQGLKDRLHTVPLVAPRGSILDRNNAVLATTVEARYVYADPVEVVDPERTAEQLYQVLGVPKSELLPKLKRHVRKDGIEQRFVYLARGIDIARADKVMALNLRGIQVRRDERRLVPGHDLAANLIGFTNQDLTGLGGLEATYNDVLHGEDGERRFEVGQEESDLGHEIPGGYHEETPARPGTTLQLTIDRDLQFEVQSVLAARMKEVKATFGCAIVLDVKTGEVLAQASYPVFNAAAWFESKPEDRGDCATGNPVDPGSVHKAIVVGAALQEGVITPDSTLAVSGSIRKGDTTYTDTHWPEKDRMTIPGILAYSSNVGTIMIADRLGPQKLYEYQRRFGLGASTHEGLPGEATGLVQPPKNWSGSSAGSIPIGMGVSVTPLQMTAAYAAIANDGVWVRPHLVRATIAPDGTVTPVPAVPNRQVMSAANARSLRTMLEAVTTVPGATGLTAAVPGYRVAGKTGTGKVVKDGRYAPGEVASFVGLAPADAPRYAIGVFAYTPGGNGGVVAGPAFKDMMTFTLAHFRVPPTGTKPPKFRVYP
ncbi:peptidoglycan D,D-transpeptidase FtsI family protein [Luedemannella helvata]